MARESSFDWRSGVLSFVISALVAWGTVTYALRSEVAGGRTMLGSIGLRYFYALMYVAPSGDPMSSELSGNPEAWKAYRDVLNELAADLRWLRRNPLYGEIVEEHASVPLLENVLLAEAMSTSQSFVASASPAGSNALLMMCELFGEVGEVGDAGPRLKLPLGDDTEMVKEVTDLVNGMCMGTGDAFPGIYE